MTKGDALDGDDLKERDHLPSKFLVFQCINRQHTVELGIIIDCPRNAVLMISQVLTLGNHENRIARAVNDDPKLDGVLSVDALEYEKFGWEVIPFLQIVTIEGIAFSHYFVTGVAGRAAGTAAAQLRKT